MNKDFYYKIGKLTIQISIPEIINVNNLKVHVPEIKETEKTKEIDLYISFMKNNTYGVTINKKSIFICGDWNSTVKNDFPHIVYGILRNYWIENEMYPVHSICFKNSLIIGHSGTGKTTLAKNVLNKGIDIFSFDKTIVSFENDKLKAKLGTDIISSRKNENERTLTTYIKNESEININQIYVFAIKKKELKVIEIDNNLVSHQLYPYFLDVTKIDVLFDNGKGIFNGTTSIESKLKLFASLNNWVNKNKSVKFISGEYEDIINYIVLNNHE